MCSFASQEARVRIKGAKVYAHPTSKALVLGKLTQGIPISVSSEAVYDEKGIAWYKIRLPENQFGYIPVNSVETFLLRQELKAAGIEGIISKYDPPPTYYRWGFRASVLIASNLNIKQTPLSGASGEARYLIPLAREGYFNHFLSAGLSFTSLQESLLGVHFIFHPTKIKVGFEEMDLQIRIGFNQGNKAYMGGGATLGFPIEDLLGKHGSIQLELATLIQRDAVLPTQIRNFYGWVAFGLEFQF